MKPTSKTQQALSLVDASTHSAYAAAKAVSIHPSNLTRALQARLRVREVVHRCPLCGADEKK